MTARRAPGTGQPPVAGQGSAETRAEVLARRRRSRRTNRGPDGGGVPGRGGTPLHDRLAQLLGPQRRHGRAGATPARGSKATRSRSRTRQEFDYSPFDASSTDGRCVIPQAGLEDAVGTVGLPLPASEDPAGIRAACGQYLGWDFSDWQVIVADSAEDRLAALLRSPDGYISRCLLDSWYLNDRGAVDNDKVFADPDGGFIPFVEITAPEKFQDEAEAFGDYRIQPSFVLGCQRQGPGQWEADCLGAGFVSGPEPIARIVVTDVTGAEHEIPVVDGWLAFAGTVINRADSRVLPENCTSRCTQPTAPSSLSTTRATEVRTACDAPAGTANATD